MMGKMRFKSSLCYTTNITAWSSKVDFPSLVSRRLSYAALPSPDHSFPLIIVLPPYIISSMEDRHWTLSISESYFEAQHITGTQ